HRHHRPRRQVPHTASSVFVRMTTHSRTRRRGRNAHHRVTQLTTIGDRRLARGCWTRRHARDGAAAVHAHASPGQEAFVRETGVPVATRTSAPAYRSEPTLPRPA